MFVFFNDTATTEIYTLSLHDALPIYSFNASTFAAREVASTRAHMYASIGGAIGALSGELHGGANVQVMKMLREIADPENVDRWVANRIQSGGRIMGMGHAVYRTTDPRADILARLSEI